MASEEPSEPPKVVRNTVANRFEITADSEVARLEYFLGTRHITLIHTEVPAALGGRGYGAVLARTALDFARASGLRVIAECPYVQAYLRRHPEYADLVKVR